MLEHTYFSQYKEAHVITQAGGSFKYSLNKVVHIDSLLSAPVMSQYCAS